MLQPRVQLALSLIALVLGAAACASTARNSGSRSAGDTPVPTTTRPSEGGPTPPPSADPCNDRRTAALSVFNRDGSRRWSIDVPVDSLGGSSGVPIVDGDVVFSGHAGSVSAVRVDNGSIEWDRPLGERTFSMWLIDGVLVVNVDQVSDHGRFVGLDPATGRTRWTYDVPGSGFLGDAVQTDDGALAFRVADDGMLTVLDASDGAVRWQRNVRDPRSSDDLPSVAPGLCSTSMPRSSCTRSMSRPASSGGRSPRGTAAW